MSFQNVAGGNWRRSKKSILVACFFVFVVGNLYCQIGQPFITNFLPTSYRSPDYTSSPNNWGVISDRNGILYFGNENIVLTYDGKKWAAAQGTRDQKFFKMAAGRDGRIYTGGLGDLGSFSANRKGETVFESMRHLLPKEALTFEKILNVVSDGNGNVYFLDKNWLFCWDGNKFATWRSKTTYRKAFSTQGKIIVQTTNDGLWSFENGVSGKIGHSEAIDSLTLKGVHLLSASKGSTSILLTKDQGMYLFDGQGLEKISSPMDSVVVINTNILPNGRIAIATEEHGLYILDSQDLTFTVVNENQGLHSNELTFPYADGRDNIWLASQIGVSSVPYPIALRKVNSTGKAKPLVMAMFDYKDEFFLGTTVGGRLLQKDDPDCRSRILPESNGFVNGFVLFQDAVLIASRRSGILSFKNGIESKISDYPSTAICLSKTDPNRLFIGTDTGLYSLRWENGKWRDEGKVQGIDHEVRHLEELPDGDLWASFAKVSRIQFKLGFTNPIVTTFDTTNGFVSDHLEFDLLEHDGKILFGSNRGIFHFDEKQQKLVPETLLGQRFAGQGHGARHLTQDLLGQIWLYDGERTGFLRKDQNGKWQWNDLPLRRMEDQEVWCIYPSPDSLIWIGTTTTLYCYDPRIPKDYHVPYHTLIDRVTVNDTSVVFYGNYADANGLLTDLQPDNYKLTFPFERNNIAFSYTATSYEYPEKTVFSHWLEGLEDDWSPWGPESDKAYNDLPEGTYTFHARSKNLYDTLGKEAAYTFTILPPWYRTWWAYVLYICAAIGVVVLIVRWQVGRANRKQEAARELERQQQRAILQTTVETQESERIRIARDLHDEVGALLSTVKMSLKLSQRKLAKDGVETSLDESTEMLDSAIGSVRQISHDLLPPSLESLGLCAALAQLAGKTAQMSGIPFECNLLHEPPRLEIRTELTLYRIVQELISNSLKHSQATERRLGFSFRDGVFILAFRDNGVGFDLVKVKDSGAGLGLRGMESRVDALGGKLQFETAQGQGFLAEISLKV